VSGAIAGTAIFRCAREAHLQLVALTINNSCNLTCPHCYLQYDGSPVLISDAPVDAVLQSSAQHVAIVGKEPLFDAKSRRRCDDLVNAADRAGKSVSLITNGLGILQCSPSLLQRTAFIDISFDGGPSTYRNYRGGSYDRLAKGLRYATAVGVREMNALHVVSAATVDNVDDMMRVQDLAAFRRIMFSLYFETKNHGRNPVAPVHFDRALEALAGSQSFRDNPAALFLVDLPLLPGWSESRVKQRITTLGLENKVHVLAADPLLYGIVRVTYDGIVLRPLDSVHPRHYREVGIPIDETSEPNSLERIYQTMLPCAA
jgi:sulfatase maturation enzyme AslB (radical SAM superfamily)